MGRRDRVIAGFACWFIRIYCAFRGVDQICSTIEVITVVLGSPWKIGPKNPLDHVDPYHLGIRFVGFLTASSFYDCWVFVAGCASPTHRWSIVFRSAICCRRQSSQHTGSVDFGLELLEFPLLKFCRHLDPLEHRLLSICICWEALVRYCCYLADLI